MHTADTCSILRCRIYTIVSVQQDWGGMLVSGLITHVVMFRLFAMTELIFDVTLIYSCL